MEDKEKIIYSGHTLDEDGNEVRHYTDDKDCLPPDLINFQEKTYEDFRITTFIREAIKGESLGYRYRIELGYVFYETPEE